MSADSGLQLAEEWGSVEENLVKEPADSRRAELSELKRGALKIVFWAVALVGGWVVVNRFLPFVVQRALQPLAVPYVAAPSRTMPGFI